MRSLHTFLLAAAFLLVGLKPIIAQEGEPQISPNALSAKVLFIDYALPNGYNFDSLEVSNGLELGYIRNINKWLNLTIPIKVGLAMVPEDINRRTFVSGDAILQGQYQKELSSVFVPYVFAGGGVGLEEFTTVSVEFPVGAGLNIRVGKNSYLNLQGEYRFSQAQQRNNMQLGVGYWFRLGKRDPNAINKDLVDTDGDGVPDAADNCPELAGEAKMLGCPDADLDGVADPIDACPDVAGSSALNGCPDADGDGIIDSEDKCPELAGSTVTMGCPDTDGDGILDKDDNCPEKAGEEATGGCPDSDGDGVHDGEDECPNAAGPAASNGCPKRDQDGDGILDAVDECPDVAGPVTSGGCPDRDGDGVPDKDDNCPDEIGVGTENGCPQQDTDGDGVLDGVDKCPDEAGEIILDGCPDNDGDGIPNNEDECPSEAGLVENNGCPVKDTDGDGVLDSSDECPDQAGKVLFQGCPDSDDDGIPDREDECPQTPGLKAFNGCPTTDADNDGVKDEEDECPTVAGTKATNGCPDADGDGIADLKDPCPDKAGPYGGCPDTDGDGLHDGLDKCPNTVGAVKNYGCPEIKEEAKEVLEFAAQAVSFSTGKAMLQAESYVILDQVAEVLKEYPDYQLRVIGHTDNVGRSSTNLILSEERAKSCYEYILSKGISKDRMTYMGKGEVEPIASNETNEGRELNRRVEFELYVD